MSDATDPMVPTPRLEDEHFAERHATFLQWISERPIDVVLVGDSITRRWQATHEENWNDDLSSFYFDDPEGNVLEVMHGKLWG